MTCEHCHQGIPRSTDGKRHESDLGVWACSDAARSSKPSDEQIDVLVDAIGSITLVADSITAPHTLTTEGRRLVRQWIADYNTPETGTFGLCPKHRQMVETGCLDCEALAATALKAGEQQHRKLSGECSWGCYYSENGTLVRDSACTVHGASTTQAKT